MPVVAAIVADLTAQSDSLDDLVAELAPERWSTPTPAQGWTIAHQVGHLLWTDRVSYLAITDGEGFTVLFDEAMKDPLGFVDVAADVEAVRAPAELLADWRETRAKLADALSGVPAGTKLPWFGPPMSAGSMATARIMETWAHGLDVAEALGVRPVPTDRIRHVVHLGVRTRDFAYTVNNKPIPAEPFRYELTAPSGEIWTWGPENAANIVRGSAHDFCELVTQRRHPADLDVLTVGDEAAEWVTIAQCFAGPPGAGRAPMPEVGDREE